MRATLVCSLLVFVPLAGVSGQDTLMPGARVRIRAPAYFEGWKEGVVRPRAVIAVRAEVPSPLAVPLSAVTGLERFAGRKSAWLIGAAVLGPIGGIFGGLVGAGLCALSEGESCGGMIVLGAASGTVVAGAIGAGIGALMRYDTWETVPLERVVITLQPLRDGVGVRARLAF